MTHSVSQVRHILIYGPPAAGKATVAKAFASAYGMRLLESHATSDLAATILERGTERFGELVASLRLALLEAAFAARVSIVATTAFIEADRSHIDNMNAFADRLGVQQCFVQLRPPRAVLEQRVTSESRAASGKIRDVDLLRSYLDTIDPYRMINPTDLIIDNASLSPAEVIRIVANRIGLPTP